MTPGTISCPNCGYEVEAQSPICGNCGQALGEYATQTSLAASGSGRGRLVLAALVIGGLGVLFWWGSGRVGDLFDNFEVSGASNGGPGAAVPDDDDSVPSPYRGIRQIAAALNDGGLECTKITVDSADEYVATGSCQAPGEFVRTHVQMSIYFNRASLDMATEIFSERVFTYVHDDNWFVLAPLPTARRVHDILGGRLVPATDA